MLTGTQESFENFVEMEDIQPIPIDEETWCVKAPPNDNIEIRPFLKISDDVSSSSDADIRSKQGAVYVTDNLRTL